MAWQRGANKRTADPDAENPGSYRHRIEIQNLLPTNPPTTNAAGQVLTWQPLLRVSASIDPSSAKDMIQSGQQTSEAEVPIKIRYRPGIAANMRVYFPSNDSTYVIQGIINKGERNRTLVLMCVALGTNL